MKKVFMVFLVMVLGLISFSCPAFAGDIYFSTVKLGITHSISDYGNGTELFMETSYFHAGDDAKLKIEVTNNS